MKLMKKFYFIASCIIEDISMNSQIFLRPPHEKTTQKTHNFGQKKNEKKAL